MTWLSEQIAKAKANEERMRAAYGDSVWDAKVAIIRAKYSAPRAALQAPAGEDGR